MKLTFVIFNTPLEDRIMRVLDKLNIKTYTKIPSVHGRGLSTEPRLDSHTWPGTNTIIFTIIEDNKVGELAGEIRSLKKEFKGQQGIKFFTVDAQDVV